MASGPGLGDFKVSLARWNLLGLGRVLPSLLSLDGWAQRSKGFEATLPARAGSFVSKLFSWFTAFSSGHLYFMKPAARWFCLILILGNAGTGNYWFQLLGAMEVVAGRREGFLSSRGGSE